MQYITTGNRIAVENFVLGDLYTITFTSGTYINSACIGIGENFVSFQRNEPELLFTLNMETAELVSSIDLYAGGTGTNNYNDLSNKPQIGGVELVGNKSLSDLGIQAEITEESPLSSSLVSGLGSAAAAESSDFATAAQGELAASAIQSAGTGLTKDGTTLNHSNSVTAQTSASFASFTYDAQGHITGSTAATTAQLNAINSGITSTDVAQIDINKTNILLSEQMNGAKNIFRTNPTSTPPTGITVNSDGTVTINGTFASATEFSLGTLTGTYSGYSLLGCTGGADNTYKLMYQYRISGGNVQVLKQFDAPVDFNLSNINWSALTIRIEAGQTVNTVIKPMICKKDFITGGMTDYQPYAMSNADLTTLSKQNQTNISSLTPTLKSHRHTFTGTDWEEDSDCSFEIPAGKKAIVFASLKFNNSPPRGIALTVGSITNANNIQAIAEITSDYGLITTTALMSNTGSSTQTINVYAKAKSAAGNDVQVVYYLI